jgi:hypothetical protein
MCNTDYLEKMSEKHAKQDEDKNTDEDVTKVSDELFERLGADKEGPGISYTDLYFKEFARVEFIISINELGSELDHISYDAFKEWYR